MIIRPIRKIHRKKRRRNRDAFFSYPTDQELLFIHLSVLVHDSLDVRGGQTTIDFAVNQSDGSQTAGTDAACYTPTHCHKYVQIRVTRGDHRFTTFRTATTFPSATALRR